MTQDREIQIALRQGCPVSEIIRMATKPRPSYAARELADELEALDMADQDPDYRMKWTRAYKARVVRLIERWRWR